MSESELTYCEECEETVSTEVVDGNVVLSCGCDPEEYLKEEDGKPLDFNKD